LAHNDDDEYVDDDDDDDDESQVEYTSIGERETVGFPISKFTSLGRPRQANAAT
jgi:hypothetical protein